MKLSGKQKRVIEILTGKSWDYWHPQAVSAYFAKTDRGKTISVPEEAQADYTKIMEYHHWHTVIVEMWKQDFKTGLLFLNDFNDEPESRKWYVLGIYNTVINKETSGH